MIDPKIRYQTEFITSSQFTDKRGFMEVPYIYRVVQEAASLQLHTYYDSLEYLKGIGKAYVILRMNIKIYKQLRPYENIKVSTWERLKGPVKMYRNHVVEDKDAEIAAEASSFWTFLDLKTRRPLPTKNIPNPVINYDEDVRADSSKKLTVADNGISVGKKRVISRDIDLFGHMNNTKYIELIFDHLPDAAVNIKEFTVEFISECKLGEELDIILSENNGVYKIHGLKSDGALSFNSEIITEV